MMWLTPLLYMRRTWSVVFEGFLINNSGFTTFLFDRIKKIRHFPCKMTAFWLRKLFSWRRGGRPACLIFCLDRCFQALRHFFRWRKWQRRQRGFELLWHADIHPERKKKIKIKIFSLKWTSSPELRRVCIPVAGSLAGGIRRLASDLHHRLPSQSLTAPSFLSFPASLCLSLACRLLSSASSQHPLEENKTEGWRKTAEKRRK